VDPTHPKRAGQWIRSYYSFPLRELEAVIRLILHKQEETGRELTCAYVTSVRTMKEPKTGFKSNDIFRKKKYDLEVLIFKISSSNCLFY
jgi:hypothetical protein